MDSVEAAFAWAEDEEDRSRESSLEGHQRFWERICAGRGQRFSLADEAVFERFRVVWLANRLERAAEHWPCQLK